MDTPLLVSTEWLADRLGDPGIRVADVRWSLLEKDKGRNGYLTAHVPGAVFLDVDSELASPRGQGPGRHPLPRPEPFAATMSRAGIGPDTHVIAYDFGDGTAAARLWWLLRYFGHERVSLLDGGIRRWTMEGRPVESAVPSYPPSEFRAKPHPEMAVNAEQVEQWRHDSATLIMDARLVERYEGRAEPVDPVAGHIPGARNHFIQWNVRSAEDPRFLPPDKLRERFRQLGVEGTERVVSYCGSGVGACQNLFALALAGYRHGLLYEGSWSDWCSVPSRPIGTGSEP